MLATFLLEETVFGILPLPWRLIPIALILALSLMHRVSFEMGAVFLLVSTLAGVFSGLAPVATVAVALVCIATSYAMTARVFARRSLVAFAGLSLATGLIYFLLRFGVVSPVPGFFPWMYLFSALLTALLAIISSLALEWILTGFGKSFVTKNQTYEVHSER